MKSFIQFQLPRYQKKMPWSIQSKNGKGLLPENLKKHEVVYRWEEVSSLDDTEITVPLPISASSCALCQHWYDEDRGCPECPLVKAGYICCEDHGSAYRKRYNNPARMVAELEGSRKC